jgi:hypothetical protein
MGQKKTHRVNQTHFACALFIFKKKKRLMREHDAQILFRNKT